MLGISLLNRAVLGMSGAVAITAVLLLTAGFHTGIRCVVLHLKNPSNEFISWWFCSDSNRSIVDYEPSPLNH